MFQIDGMQLPPTPRVGFPPGKEMVIVMMTTTMLAAILMEEIAVELLS